MYVPLNKNRSIKITIVLLILFCMALSVSCSNKPQNSNEPQNNPNNQSLNSSDDMSESVDEESNQENESGDSTDSQVNEPVQQESFAEYARIMTWYSTGGFSSETAWVHFKAVDAEDYTIMEVLGSDEMNMREEQNALAETSIRRELVDQLREDMTLDGWTEIGVAEGSEWYEYIFGR